MKEWVASTIRDLVDRPESVEVREVDEDGVIVLEVMVDSREMGRVIGRQGRTVQALRTLLSVAGARHGKDYELEILE